MNTYQSPYIDGQVLEETEMERNAAGASPLAVSQTDAKISGCTTTASDCLHKTTKLARELNHGTVSAAHLVLAMTLIPKASCAFAGKVDADKAFRASMHALIDIERGSPVNGALPSLSAEFKSIVTLAQDLARKREQEVSVEDLLNAFDRLPSDSPAAQLIRGEQRSGPSLDTRQALDQLAYLVNHQLQEIKRQIDTLRFDGLGDEIGRLKSYLQARDGGLEQQVRDGFEELAKRLPPGTPIPPSPKPPVEPLRPNSIWDMFFGNGGVREPEHLAPAGPAQTEAAPSQVRWGG
jgi:hypothetical protein